VRHLRPLESLWLLTEDIALCSVNYSDVECITFIYNHYHFFHCRPQWPRGLRRGPAVTRMLRLRVRIPPGTWMSFSCECCMLSGIGLCDELITRPEKSYWLWCVVVCELETSWMRRPWPTGRSCEKKKKKSLLSVGLDNAVIIATRYRLHGPGIESRWQQDFPHLPRSAPEPSIL
jgi:hypothetical protein